MKHLFKTTGIFVAFLFTVTQAFADMPLSPDNPGKAPKFKDRPSVALVLGGGGALGFSEIPLLELLEELDIPVDMIFGTSIGSIFGGLYSAGYTPQELLKEVSEVDWTPLFADNSRKPYEATLEDHSIYGNALTVRLGTNLKPKLGTGISNGENVYALLRHFTAKYPSNIDFDDLPTPFRCIGTDMITGNTDILHQGDLAEAIRASMSIPGVFQPWQIDDKYYVDGGVKNNLAIDIAHDMGYDIIIAVELRSPFTKDYDNYESNPGVALMNMLAWSQIDSAKEKYKLADIVIHPELKGYNLLSFSKANEIYQIGLTAATEYRPQLSELRKRIYPKDYDSAGNRISISPISKPRKLYRDMPHISVNSISVENAYPADEAMIISEFNTANKDNNIELPEIEQILNAIYFTGNYTSVMPRVIKKEDGSHELNIILRKANERMINILLGIEFEQTFSSEYGFSFELNPGVQVRGLTGPGSVISLKGTLISDYGAHLFIRQPIIPDLYIEGNSNFRSDSYLYSQNFTINNINFSFNNGSEIDRWDNDILLCYRTNFGTVLKSGIFYDTYMSPISKLANQGLTDSDLNFYLKYPIGSDTHYGGSAFGITLKGSHDTLNTNSFPTKGFSIDGSLKYCFPYTLAWQEMPQMLIGTIDLKGVFPITDKLSIKAGLTAGTDFLHNLDTNPSMLVLEGYSSYDRTYFPQVISLGSYGSQKFAGLLSLQYQPVNSLTIVGLQPFFRITGTVGRTGRSWEQLFSIQPTDNYDVNTSWLWTTSLDIGLRVSDGFSILMRGGVCSNFSMPSEAKCTGFFSVDIGAFLF